MSFGKLNILQHKSWNVWNRDNIEKVLKDEREHKEKEALHRERKDAVESETRTQVLRKRKADQIYAGETPESRTLSVRFQGEGGDDGPGGRKAMEGGQADDGFEAKKGFNLFESLHGVYEGEVNGSSTTAGQNVDREDEKRKEKEKEQRQWGLVGLGEDNFTGESYGAKPWYASAQRPSNATYSEGGISAVPHGSLPFSIAQEPEMKRKRDEKLKAHNDPMVHINKHIKDKKKHSQHKKDAKHHKSKHSLSSREKSDAEKDEMMKKLRAERVERERYERERVASIMGGVSSEAPKAAQRSRDDDPRSGYNSGFAQFHGGKTRQERRGGW